MISIYHQKIDDVWYAAATEGDKVFATAFSPDNEEEALRHLLKNLPYNIPFQAVEKPTQPLAELLTAMKAIFDGKNVSSSFKTSMNQLPSYTQRVLNCTSLIPVGYLTTYGAIAKVAGGSPRSVGRAEASNPFPLLVPCHRVVRSDFSIGGYGLGVKVKFQILQREDRGYEKTTVLKVNGKTLPLFSVKHLRKMGGKN